MELSKVDFRPAASTDTSVTSASPIISADAVEAVRAGLRIALPRASLPAVPPIFVAGQPSTARERRHERLGEHRDADEQAGRAEADRQQASAVESEPTNRPDQHQRHRHRRSSAPR